MYPLLSGEDIDLVGDDVDFLMGEDDDDDLMGDDEDLVGFRGRARRRRRRARRHRAAGPSWAQSLLAPGVSGAGERVYSLPLGLVSYAAAELGIKTLTGAVQRPFRGERLVLIANRSAGAAGNAVSIRDLRVGTVSQNVAIGDQPVETYGPTAFGVRLVIDATVPGVNITADINVPVAVPAGESISVSGVILGRSLS